MSQKPLILSVETATLSGSVAVSRGTEILSSSTGDSGVSHSHTLLGDIDTVLAQTDVGLADIDLFAVASGPGSFTGLRIGIATVKALAATLIRPCVGIPTLQAVALAAGDSFATVALLPAGRGEVFAQLFSVSVMGLVTPLDEAAHISPRKLLEKYGSVESVLWCGDGAHRYREMIEGWAVTESRTVEFASSPEEEGGTRDWRLAPQTTDLARQVSSLALAKFGESQFEEPSALQAIYVRPSDAELKV